MSFADTYQVHNIWPSRAQRGTIYINFLFWNQRTQRRQQAWVYINAQRPCVELQISTEKQCNSVDSTGLCRILVAQSPGEIQPDVVGCSGADGF